MMRGWRGTVTRTLAMIALAFIMVTTLAGLDADKKNVDRNERLLFDINRNAAIMSKFLVDDPGPLTNRLMADQDLPFAITFVTWNMFLNGRFLKNIQFRFRVYVHPGVESMVTALFGNSPFVGRNVNICKI